jgi:transposase
MYQRKSRLSIYKQGELIKMFVAGATARASAEIVGVNKHTAANFYKRLLQLHQNFPAMNSLGKWKLTKAILAG